MKGTFHVVVFVALAVAATLHGSLAQTTHVVGDSLGWLVPPGGDAAYRTWAATKTFNVGDVLVFNFTTGVHDVAEVRRAAYDSCNSTSPISMFTDGPTRITLTSAGEHYYICTFQGHCDLGQKLAINVSAASGAPAPQPTTPPAAAPAPSPSRVGMTYTVGDSLGWLVPPGGPVAYQTWARGKSFMLGDTLVFNFTNGAHDVLEVTRPEFDSCNVAATTTTPIRTSPARITLNSAGEHYYICTFPQHCSLGQKLAINVTAGGSTATPPSTPAPAPSSTGTPPPRSTAPSPSSGGPTSQPTTPTPSNTPSEAGAPPLSNSAPSFAVAALPFAVLAAAFAVLFN